jgi:signal transduction histidine kinase
MWATKAVVMTMTSVYLSDQAAAELQMLRQQVALLEQRDRGLYQELQSTVARLREARDELMSQNARLERTNRELQITHDLTMAMQSTPDSADVQERVLALITSQLGFERAILAIADLHDAALTGWLCSTRGPGGALQRIPHTTHLPLTTTAGLLSQAVLEARPLLVTDGQPPTNNAQINAWLGVRHYAVLPMVMRNRPLGVVLVDNPDSGRPISAEDLASLANIARQAAMVIGNVQLCVDRTQRLAVEEERSRIAMEIHDAISQQLYGITYTLDACIKVLPERVDEVRERLTYLLPEAQQATAAIRRAIFDLWPDELDAERFAAELRGYAYEIVPSAHLQLEIQIDAHFDTLAIGVRKQLYRIAQEALTNVIKHAHARRADIILTAEAGELRLTIADDGRGFDPAGDRAEDHSRSHLGLINMRARAQALGGRLQIQSQPAHGTRITVTLP